MRRLMLVIVATAAMTASTTAVADLPLQLDAQLGISVPQRDDRASELTLFAPAIAVAAAYRATDRLSVGARVSATRLRFDADGIASSARLVFDRSLLVPIDVSLTASYEAHRGWVAPWLGWRFTRVAPAHGAKHIDGAILALEDEGVFWTSSSWSAGVVGGYRVWSWGRQHLGPFLELSIGERARAELLQLPPRSARFAAVTLGLALQR